MPTQQIPLDRFVDEQRIGRFTLNVVFWCFLAMFSDGYEITSMALAATELRGLWHIPAAAFTWALSASSFGILLGAPAFGWLGDRYGRKRAIVWSTLVCALSTLAVVGANSIGMIALLRLITGIGIGGLMPNTIALASETAPKRRRATLVVLMFAGSLWAAARPG